MNERGYVVSLYRSPSQTQDELDIFLISFEQLIGDIIAKNLLFVLIAGDFNVRSTNWWKNIFLRLKVPKSILSLPPIVCVRLFLIQLIFFQIHLPVLI